MSRCSPLDAALWVALLDEGRVRCRGCDVFVELPESGDINDAVAAWNTHVQTCPEAV